MVDMSSNTILFLNDFQDLKKSAADAKKEESREEKRHRIHIDLTPEEYYVLGIMADVHMSSRTSIAHELINEFSGLMNDFIEEGQADIAFLHMQLVGFDDPDEKLS